MERLPRGCDEKFISPMSEDLVEVKERTEQEKRAICSLQFVINRLNEEEKNGLKYAIVGGVALIACMGAEYEPIRENNTLRDLDVVILDDPHNIIPEIEEEIEEKKEELPLPVEFNKSKAESYHSNIQLRAHFKGNQDGYSLVFRDIEEKIPSELMEREDRDLRAGGGILTIKTFKPGVLLHLYLKRSGGFKYRDRGKIISLLKDGHYIAGTDEEHQEHKKYKMFHQFAKKIRKKYPLYTSTVRAFNLVDHILFNSLLGHKIIPRGIIKKIIDL